MNLDRAPFDARADWLRGRRRGPVHVAKIASSKSHPCGADQYCYSPGDADAINTRMVTAEVLAGVAPPPP